MLARFVNSLPLAVSQRITKYYFRLRSLGRGVHSFPQYYDSKTMEVTTLPALQDNYMYLIVDKLSREAAVVDPVDPDSVLKAVQQAGLNLTTVLTTHHHWDHAGGNEGIARMVQGLRIYGGDARIGGLTHTVENNTTLNIGNLNVQCLSTPCHTSGHICYYVTSPQETEDRAVFTGDTLFLGGCGRFFEGTPNQMYHALIEVLSCLPVDTKVFCGHEYTLQNLKFAAHVEPQNKEVTKKLFWSQERRQQSLPTVPSTIGEERLYNPFMRVTEPALMKYANSDNAIEVMRKIRLEKDSFH